MNLEELFSFNLCTRCTGRIFAGIGTGLTNKERGESLLFAYNALIGSMQEKHPATYAMAYLISLINI